MSKYKRFRALALPPYSDVLGSTQLGSRLGALASCWVTLVPRSNGLTNRAVAACLDNEAGSKAGASGRRFKALQVVQLRIVVTHEGGGLGGRIVVPQQALRIEAEEAGGGAGAAAQLLPQAFVEVLGDPRLMMTSMDIKGRALREKNVGQWRSGGSPGSSGRNTAIACLGALDSCIIQVYLNCQGCDTEKIFIDNLVQRRMKMKIKAYTFSAQGVAEELVLEVPFLNENL